MSSIVPMPSAPHRRSRPPRAAPRLATEGSAAGVPPPGADWTAIALELGMRLRAARAARGLTVAALAASADLSRRFLTDVELGKANLSLQVLARLAAALHLDLAALLTPAAPARPGAAPQRWRVHSLVDQLPDHALDEASTRLAEIAATQPSPHRFALIGLRGAGKSSIGRAVARRLKLAFIELDHEVEARAGMPLADLFTLHGESYYRQLERETLETLLTDERPLLVATGGGIVAAPETYALLRRRFVTVWLKATPEEHWNRVVEQGDSRPMQGQPAAMARLREILAERAPLYRLAHHVIDTSALGEAGSAEQLATLLQGAR